MIICARLSELFNVQERNDDGSPLVVIDFRLGAMIITNDEEIDYRWYTRSH